jgi:hypothetical protein
MPLVERWPGVAIVVTKRGLEGHWCLRYRVTERHQLWGAGIVSEELRGAE